jgi:hypothetical protein
MSLGVRRRLSRRKTEEIWIFAITVVVLASLEMVWLFSHYGSGG